MAQKLFGKFVKQSKLGWIKELDIIHTKLSLLEEWTDSLDKMKSKWLGMSTDVRPAETVEKKMHLKNMNSKIIIIYFYKISKFNYKKFVK